MAALKPRPQPPEGPRVVVIVPRAVLEDWIRRPWVEIVAGAESNHDGLRLATEAERATFVPAADTAQLREMSGYFGRGRASLYKQGW